MAREHELTPYYDSGGITIYHGDNVETLQTFPADCVDLTVTSPPYDNLRTYGGHSWDFEGVASELWRVTKPGGVVVWVVADATVDGSETGSSFRQALRFMDIGFRLNDTMIFEKRMVFQPTKDVPRYYQTHEYMFILSKGKPASFNPICDIKNNCAGERSKVYAGNSAYNDRINIGAEFTIKDYRRRGSVWKYSTGKNHSSKDSIVVGHTAIFPEALARDHILSWSNEGDTVLDPFSGSGTTLKMAKETGRTGIGVEIEDRYCAIAANRLRQSVLNFGE